MGQGIKPHPDFNTGLNGFYHTTTGPRYKASSLPQDSQWQLYSQRCSSQVCREAPLYIPPLSCYLGQSSF